METSPEVVVAAEAVRAWVRTQRAGWTTPQVHSFRVAAPSVPQPMVSSPAVVLPMPAPAPAPQRAMAPSPAPAPAHPLAPAPEPATHAAVSGHLAPLVDEPPFPAPAVANSRDTVPFLSRLWVRAAASVALIAALAAGAVFLRGRAGLLTTTPKTGTAMLASEPEGAQVTVDGEPAGTTPLTLTLPAGAHRVEFSLKSSTRRQTINVVRGKETAVSINWNAKPLGSLRVEARPTPARVLVDGKERGTVPLTIADLAVGTHTVQIDSAEGSVRRKVEIAEGRTETLTEEIFPGWLHVSSPVEVTVVDGRQTVQLDASNRVLLKPGPHTIRLQNTTLQIAETRQVMIEPGGTARVSLDPPPSTLTVTGSIGAEVFVDGTKAGETPLTDYRIALGSHDVMVVDRSGVSRHATVTVTTRPALLDVAFGR
ncbi:MAG: PEGA domain-containing protein [Vicinamibacterales bacterium]